MLHLWSEFGWLIKHWRATNKLVPHKTGHLIITFEMTSTKTITRMRVSQYDQEYTLDMMMMMHLHIGTLTHTPPTHTHTHTHTSHTYTHIHTHAHTHTHTHTSHTYTHTHTHTHSPTHPHTHTHTHTHKHTYTRTHCHTYTHTLSSHGGRILNFKINGDGTQFYIAPKKRYNSVHALLDAYKTTPIKSKKYEKQKIFLLRPIPVDKSKEESFKQKMEQKGKCIFGNGHLILKCCDKEACMML